jgi:methionyl-tRNA synthetase
VEHLRREDEQVVGNIVDPFALADKYSAEAVRYYLISDIATGKDANFGEDRLIERYNPDLANNLGNLLSRTLTMIHRFRQGLVHKATSDSIKVIAEQAKDTFKMYTEWMNKFSVDAAMVATGYLADRCNQKIDMLAPWNLAKDSSQSETLNAILYHLAEALRIIGILISPVLPKAAHGIFDQLNWKMELSGKEERFSLKDAEWGKLPDGRVVGKAVPLFPRIETD